MIASPMRAGSMPGASFTAFAQHVREEIVGARVAEDAAGALPTGVRTAETM